MHFPDWTDNNHSLVRRYLTRDIFNQLCDKVTANGYTFEQAIASGVANQDSSIGIYAGDAQTYQMFAALLWPIIEDYHRTRIAAHSSDLEAARLPPEALDPDGLYIRSTRIRVARNLAGFPLGPALTTQQRAQIEAAIVAALSALTGDFAGRYYPLYKMNEEDRLQLIADHFLFKAGDRFLEAAGLNRDWPQSRGIFHNHDKTFLVWINEEDQLRIISMQPGGDLRSVFQRLAQALTLLGQRLEFSFDEQLGYLTSCPTNLGTAMRASVHIHLPQLAQQEGQIEKIATQYHLQVRGIHGEHSASEGAVFDVSNSRRLGVTEVDGVCDLYAGVQALIAAEKSR